MSECNHFKLPIKDPGPCLTCEREAEGVSGPLVSFAGGRENWRSGQTTGEYIREMKADLEHLPKDRHPEPVNRGRWV